AMGMNSLDRRHAMGLYAALAALLLVGTSAAATAPQPIEELCGVYELQSGEHIYIQPWPGGGGQLSYSDDAGTVRSLVPLSRDVFTAGPGLAVRDPVEMRFTFRRDSRRQVTSVMREQMIRGRSLRSAAARLHAYRREDVSFSSGEGANALRIAGSLLLPAGKGPFPA